MSRFTRLTLVGSQRRAEVVVPSDEGFAAMLPQLLDLLGEPTSLSPQAVALVRVTGDQIDLALDCADQDLADGEVLRVVRTADAPPPPEVADVTDVAADELAGRGWRWGPVSRQAVGASVAGIGAGTAALAGRTDRSGGGAIWVLVAVGLVSLAAAAGLGRAGHRYACLVLMAVPTGLAVPVAVLARREAGLAPPDAARLALLLAWIAVGVGIGLGRRDRGALMGAAAGAGLTALSLLLGLVLTAREVDALVGVVAVVACGLLPWYALAASGLTALDDAVLDGATPRRARVRTSLDEAYRALTWTTAAVALAVIGSTTGLLTAGTWPTTALGLVLVTIVALRSRGLPLTVQVSALWAAAVLPLVALVLGPLAARPALGASLAAAGAAVVALAAGAHLSSQRRALLRRTADVVELGCVLATAPLTLAAFGAYTDLLRTF